MGLTAGISTAPPFPHPTLRGAAGGGEAEGASSGAGRGEGEQKGGRDGRGGEQGCGDHGDPCCKAQPPRLGTPRAGGERCLFQMGMNSSSGFPLLQLKIKAECKYRGPAQRRFNSRMQSLHRGKKKINKNNKQNTQNTTTNPNAAGYKEKPKIRANHVSKTLYPLVLETQNQF